MSELATLRQNGFISSVKTELTLPLDRMSLGEKLRLMEALWADLSRNGDEFESPAWHEVVLKERQAKIKSGKESFLDWEAAKNQLRAKLKT